MASVVSSGKQYSNLSSPRYGYDTVCAVTQAAMNSTMLEYLMEGHFETAEMYYVAQMQGNSLTSVPISRKDLLTATGGVDPFFIPADANPANPSDSHYQSFQAIQRAKFMFGFRATLGMPPGVDPTSLTVIELSGGTANVAYNMYCSDFQVVNFIPGEGYDPNPQWYNVSQPAGQPFVFSAHVNLIVQEVADPTKLPPSVYKRISSKAGWESAFSIQQLMFDLNSAFLNTVPTFQSPSLQPSSPVYTALMGSFLGLYFNQMKAKGQPLLNVGVISKVPDRSDFRPTAIQRQVCPFQGPASPNNGDLATLNYLCACFNHTLPPAVPFTWNWVSVAEETQTDGVIAIQRNTMASWLLDRLIPLATKSCFTAWTDATMDPKVNLSGQVFQNGKPTGKITDSGAQVIEINFEDTKDSTTGINGSAGEIKLQPSYQCTVTFQGSQIQIYQRVACYLYVKYWAVSEHGNFIDRRVTDVYDLAVDAQGDLSANLIPGKVQDFSQNLGKGDVVNFFTGIDDVTKALEGSAWMNTANFGAFPISVIQDFIFPGGKVFAFSKASFSDNQDFTANIIYTEPS